MNLDAIVVSSAQREWYEHTGIFHTGMAKVSLCRGPYVHSNWMSDCIHNPWTILDFCKMLYETGAFCYVAAYTDDILDTPWQWYR